MNRDIFKPIQTFLETYKDCKVELGVAPQSDFTWKCEYAFTCQSTTGQGTATGMTRRAAHEAGLQKAKLAIDALL